jgi:hypothetical protein
MIGDRAGGVDPLGEPHGDRAAKEVGQKSEAASAIAVTKFRICVSVSGEKLDNFVLSRQNEMSSYLNRCVLARSTTSTK